MPIPRAASCETTSGPPGGWTAAPNTYIREEAKQSGPEKSVGRDSSEKKRGVCHVSLERNTRPATFHICKQQRTRGAVAKRRACTDHSCTRAKYFRLKRRRPLPEARSDSSAAALRGSDRDTAEGGAFTQTAPPQQCGCKPEGRSGDAIRCPEKWVGTFVEAVVQADSAGADVIVSAGIPLRIRQTVEGKICEKLQQEAADARPLARRAQRWTSMPTPR